MAAHAALVGTYGPICILCMDQVCLDYARIFDEVPEWKICADRDGIVPVESAKTLNDVYFKIPWHWKCIGRAFVGGYGEEMSLTGVGILRGYFNLPVRPSEVVMVSAPRPAGAGKAHPLYQKMYVSKADPVTSPDTLHSYMMHERCWVLLSRVIDIRLIEENMTLFVDSALTTQLRHHASLGSLRGMFDDEAEWAVRRYEAGSNLSLQEQADFIRNYSRGWRCDDGKYAWRDPWKVNDIWGHILDEWKVARMENRNVRIATSETQCATVGMNMPPELIMDILDLLPSSQETRYLMWAFPHWAARVPFTYWRRRFIQDFMLEDDEKDLPIGVALHWRRLYYKTDRIHRTSHGLRNRRRIMSLLEGVRDSFFQELARRRTQA
ncbi:hypothetical protein BJX61DRAFT_539144 [Aspergillus egyptiacus]|nr:hypothetical protein BJX61DRAFT_539144 [Aspergillus egyptiacus]